MTDSAQEAAVDAVADILRRFPGFRGDSATVARKRVAGDIIDALLSPTKKPCAECGEGAGRVRGPADDAIEKATGWPHSLTYKCPNPDCIDGFVASPAPIEGLLERADTVHVVDPGGSARRFPTAEPVFRLPSKVREG